MDLLNFDVKKLKTVSIGKVKANNYNPKEQRGEKYKKVLASIKINGLMAPVFVREIKKDKYEIIDGEQRFHACEDLDYKDILIYNYGKLSDTRAMELTVWWQEQVSFDEIKLAELFVSLMDKVAGDYNKIKLPFTEEEIQEKIDMLKFDWDTVEIEAEEREKESCEDAVKCPYYGTVDCHYYKQEEQNKKTSKE